MKSRVLKSRNSIAKSVANNKAAIKRVLDDEDFSFVSKASGKQIVSEILKEFTEFSKKFHKEKFRIALIEHESTTGVSIFSENIPFLIDSALNFLRKRKFDICSVHHPKANIKKDDGSVMEVAFPHFFLNAVLTSEQKKEMIESIEEILSNVGVVVSDWAIMKEHMMKTSKHIMMCDPKRYDQEEFDESSIFLNWLLSKNFIFLGSFSTDAEFKVDKKNLKGLMKKHPEYQDLCSFTTIRGVGEEWILKIKKFNDHSLVHRDTDMDLIVVKHFDYKSKKVIGFDCFLGFFTTAVYLQSTVNIPLIRLTLARIMKKYSYNETNFSSKEFLKAIELFPREELMQMEADELYEIAINIVELALLPKERVFVRQVKDDRYYSCIVFIPKERFSTKIKNAISQFICKKYNSMISRQYTNIGEGPLARVHTVLKFNHKIHEVDHLEIEREIYNIISEWEDKFKDNLKLEFGPYKGTELFKEIIDNIPSSYKNTISPNHALSDMKWLYFIEGLDKTFKMYIINEKEAILKVYDRGYGTALSEFIPVLDNMDIAVDDILTHRFGKKNGDEQNMRMLSIYKISPKVPSSKFVIESEEKVEEVLRHMHLGELVNDKFNALIINGGFKIKEVAMFRSFSHYMKQIKFPLEEKYIIYVLNKHVEITNAIRGYFLNKFDPELKRRNMDEESILHMLEDVQSITEDQVLSFYFQLVKAIKRTNYFQPAPGTKSEIKRYLSYKIKSSELPNIPLPLMYFEIFVYSRNVEGVHLRGDKVARGGLRMSDRFEDYRTEVLGLVKAQMTKNAVIVPLGSKGCFIVKADRSDKSRKEIQADNITAYQTFLKGILDLTDNIKDGKVIHPKNTVRYDEVDPYLVVAADKGTATFSDHANEISAQYEFWLGDAFASGGSYGYDHKKMGITAKGAWISVLNHLESLGVDADKDPFTVVGIGDMSGDVFGNGMLLSKQIKLIGAFNHLHIFIDPNPDSAKSFKERQRLFKLSRSTWGDYNKKLISKGGGVFSRSMKSIPLTSQMQELLKTKAKFLAPDSIINLLLKASVDLLWNGGIGTYVKSSQETNEIIGDKANDSVRVNGSEIRAKTIGEGGNLGMTQRGRMEYDRAGGIVNTDFIDNSAGVDCSDHEVNIKIVLNRLMEESKLSFDARNRLLGKMVDDIEKMVLRDNLDQNTVLTIEERRGISRLQDHEWLIKLLEFKGELDRDLEFLPTEQEILSIKSQGLSKGLTRPSISVLVSYAKNYIFKTLNSDVDFRKTPVYEELVMSYFPKLMRDGYPDMIKNHQLGNEIVCTIFSNEIINKLGVCYFYQIMEEFSPKLKDVCLAFHMVCKLFNINKYWRLLQEAKFDINLKFELQRKLQIIMGRNVRWILQNIKGAQNIKDVHFLESEFDLCQKRYNNLLNNFDKYSLEEDFEAMISSYREVLSENSWVEEIVKMRMIINALDIIKIAVKKGGDIPQFCAKYFEIGRRMQINWALDDAISVETENYVDKFAIKSLIPQLLDAYGKIVSKSLSSKKSGGMLSDAEIASYVNSINQIKSVPNLSTVSMLAAIVRKLENLL